MKHSPTNVQKKDKETLPVECVCKSKVLLKDFISHARQCNHIKVQFGTLPESIDNCLKSVKDKAGLKVLFYLFSQAKSACSKNLKGSDNVAVPPPVPMPVQMPVPMPVPVPDPANKQKGSYPFPIANDKIPDVKRSDQKEEDKVANNKLIANRNDEIINESSVFCKVCNTRFLDFNQILYLDRCMHPFCKEDLKKHIFK